MWSLELVSCLLVFLWTYSSSWADDSDHPRLCVDRVRDCAWYCGNELPLVNRSSTGAFQTEFLRPFRHRMMDAFSSQKSSIFIMPGLQSGRCLEMSVRCGPTRYGPNQSAPYNHAPNRRSMLQLIFRCEHFVVTYLAYYNGPDDCYYLELEHFAHRMRRIHSNCLSTFLQPYLLLGDGHRYFLILFCYNHVLLRKSGQIAYWLFVNKRNTPEQNRDIVLQLSTTAEELRDPPDGLLDEDEPPGVCRCNLFERYFLAVQRCNKPFLALRGSAPGSSFRVDDQSEGGTPVSAPPGTDRLADDRLRWFVVKCVVVSVGLGIVVYAVLLQLERKIEEPVT